MTAPTPPVHGAPPSAWEFPDPAGADEEGFLALGADLQPGTVLAAYRRGIFPMPLSRLQPMAWWSPDPRGVLPLDALLVSRSLRRSTRNFEVRVDTAFARVLTACADRRRKGGWISASVREAYLRLHELGWAHSVESWTPDGRLAGGLYGLAIGGLFAGESMWHEHADWARDASKVALVALVSMLRADGDERRLLDVQWRTDHLGTMGVVDVPRESYLQRLSVALQAPLPAVFAVAGQAASGQAASGQAASGREL